MLPVLPDKISRDTNSSNHKLAMETLADGPTASPNDSISMSLTPPSTGNGRAALYKVRCIWLCSRPRKKCTNRCKSEWCPYSRRTSTLSWSGSTGGHGLPGMYSVRGNSACGSSFRKVAMATALNKLNK